MRAILPGSGSASIHFGISAGSRGNAPVAEGDIGRATAAARSPPNVDGTTATAAAPPRYAKKLRLLII